MFRLTFIVFLISILFSYENSREIDFAIVIHGGAGTILKKNMSKKMESAYDQKLKEALNIGYKILEDGGSSVDAVESTIKVLANS